ATPDQIKLAFTGCRQAYINASIHYNSLGKAGEAGLVNSNLAFEKVQKAYKALSDPKQREAHDRKLNYERIKGLRPPEEPGQDIVPIEDTPSSDGVPFSNPWGAMNKPADQPVSTYTAQTKKGSVPQHAPQAQPVNRPVTQYTKASTKPIFEELRTAAAAPQAAADPQIKPGQNCQPQQPQTQQQPQTRKVNRPQFTDLNRTTPPAAAPAAAPAKPPKTKKTKTRNSFKRSWRDMLEDRRKKLDNLRPVISTVATVTGLGSAWAFNWFQAAGYNPTAFNMNALFNIGVGLAVGTSCYVGTDCAVKLVTRPHRIRRAVFAGLITAGAISGFNYATHQQLSSDFAIPSTHNVSFYDRYNPYPIYPKNVTIGMDNLQLGITNLIRGGTPSP
ncbi:MAG: hypothetical protein WCD70_16480, partial [Alphaproteobacteria bacterium]